MCALTTLHLYTKCAANLSLLNGIEKPCEYKYVYIVFNVLSII